jgi:hypothetical protein
MSDLAVAQRLGRRMNHLLVDQSLFAWTHRILGFIAGSTCVLATIATTQFFHGSGFTRGFGGGIVAGIFFAAASPFVVSYSTNFDRVDDSLSQTVWFAVCLVGLSVLVDIGTVELCLSEYSGWWLLAIYFCQASAYVLLGELMLGRNDRLEGTFR